MFGDLFSSEALVEDAFLMAAELVYVKWGWHGEEQR